MTGGVAAWMGKTAKKRAAIQRRLHHLKDEKKKVSLFVTVFSPSDTNYTSAGSSREESRAKEESYALVYCP